MASVERDEAGDRRQMEPGPVVVEAVVEDQHLAKTMTWWDGFVLALANPGFLVAALGGSVTALGTTGALVLWVISVVLGSFQNTVYAELATMFPGKSGGIALYAHEAWRRYFSVIGPLVAFGYWFAWSTVLSISGKIAGTLTAAEFFPTVTFSVTGGHFHLDLPTSIAIATILLVWGFNVFGIRTARWLSYVTGLLLMIPLLILMVAPYFTGDWSGANMTSNVGANGGIALALTWLYFMGWSSYGFEVCATVAPEYHNTTTDTPKALRAAAVLSIVVYALLPLGVGGTLGTDKIAADTTAIVFFKDALDTVAGPLFGNFFVVCLVAGIVLTMSTATVDGSRALWQIAKDKMTIRWFSGLNRHQVPGRSMALDALLNIFLVVFFGSAIEIIAAGNLGYMLAHVFALSGFLLLRRDRPDWPRPIRLSAVWVPIAGVLAAVNLVLVVCGGFLFANSYGYGLSKTLVGVAILLIALVLFVYRRRVQDGQPIQWREETPTRPSTAEARST